MYRSGDGGGGPAICDPASELLLGGRREREESSARIINGMEEEKNVIKLSIIQYPVAPVAYQVILEPGICQLFGFESPRVHTRINSWGLFLVDKLTCGTREKLS